jgi:hypothetical protein
MLILETPRIGRNLCFHLAIYVGEAICKMGLYACAHRWLRMGFQNIFFPPGIHLCYQLDNDDGATQ